MLRGACPEDTRFFAEFILSDKRLLRFARNDKERRARNDKMGNVIARPRVLKQSQGQNKKMGARLKWT